MLAAIFIVIAVYQLYLNQWLQIRWRRWMTAHYLGEWLHQANHYRMQLQGDAADNPDQRMTDDVKLFVDRTLNIGVGLLSSIVTLASFVAILWGLSNAAPLHLFGQDFAIPGYLVWGALIYAVLGTMLTHLIGWPLVGIDFRQQQFEADFRFNLVRVRENSEQIALLRGEEAERERLLVRFGRVVENWLAIMMPHQEGDGVHRQLFAGLGDLSLHPGGAGLLREEDPARRHDADRIGVFAAFRARCRSSSPSIASWPNGRPWSTVSTDSRRAIAAASAACHTQATGSTSVAAAGDGAIDLKGLTVRLPNGTPLVTADGFSLRKDERTLVTGPSGSGKSTLFRAIAGIWPFGAGSIAIPRERDADDAAAAAVFPGRIAARRDRLSRQGRDASPPARSPRRSKRSDCRSSRRGSTSTVTGTGRCRSASSSASGSRARCCMRRNYLFLDEATASLDEPSEAALYQLLGERLPATTIVSIGHRSTLEAFHQRNVARLVRDGDAISCRKAAAIAEPPAQWPSQALPAAEARRSPANDKRGGRSLCRPS